MSESDDLGNAKQALNMECDKEREYFDRKPHYFARESTEKRFAHN